MALGELEQLILLAVLQLGEEARAIDVRRLIAEATGREVARGSIYAGLERLTEKGHLEWQTEDTTPARGGIPRRRFEVTPHGLEELRSTHQAVAQLSRGLGSLLAK